MDVATVNAGLVAVLAVVIAFASWRALLQTGNSAIRFIIAAFLVLAVKGAAKAYTLSSGEPESRAVEIVFSYMDLAVVALVAWPILLRRSNA